MSTTPASSFFARHKQTLFALVFIILYSVTVAYATPPASKYQPGATLDPACAPGDTNCGVEIYPDLTGNNGKVLMTDGTTLFWGSELPDQTGHSGQFLTTNGTTASWGSFSSLFPSQSGHAGQALIADGSGGFSWGSELFNGNRTVSRSGVPNINPGGTTIKDFLENYFFPATGPGASISLASGSTARELGSSTAVSLNWSATKATNSITSITLSVNNGGSYSSGTPITATGNSQSGSATGTSGSNTSSAATTFSITVSDGSLTASSSLNINYYNRMYYGVSAVASSISDGQIQGLPNSPLSTGRTLGSTAFSPSAQYIYFVWPASFEPGGGCNAVLASDGVTSVGTTNCFFQGSTPITDFLVETRSFTNASGYTSSYKIYRSGNLLNGSISYSVQ